MKTLRILLGCLLLTAAATFGQTTQSINLYTSGSTTQQSITLTPGSTFSLDTLIAFTGFTSTGLSYWLEAQNGLAQNLTLNSENYFQNWDPNSTGTNNTFTGTTGTEANFFREGRDLGSTSTFTQDNNGAFVAWNDPRAPGTTYKVSTLNFTLGAGIAPGTYQIAVTDLSPIRSEINDDQATPGAHTVAQTFYTITVVPEPATWSLMGLGGLGTFGLTWLRARRKS